MSPIKRISSGRALALGPTAARGVKAQLCPAREGGGGEEGDGRSRNSHSLARSLARRREVPPLAGSAPGGKPNKVSRASKRARGLLASALQMKPSLERLSTRPAPSDFRPATPPLPCPTRAEDAGLHQSLSACGRSGWGLRDSKGAPPPRSGFPGLGCGRKTPSAGGEASQKVKTEGGVEVWCGRGAAGSRKVAWGEEEPGGWWRGRGWGA